MKWTWSLTVLRFQNYCLPLASTPQSLTTTTITTTIGTLPKTDPWHTPAEHLPLRILLNALKQFCKERTSKSVIT
ncbi:Protein sak1, partial [Frankliniella fusca]